MNTSIPAKLSPMRILKAWLGLERTLRGPAAIELAVVDRQITREAAAVAAATNDAREIEREVQQIEKELQADIDKRALTPKEARRLARELQVAVTTTRRHAHHLEALA